MPVRYRFNKDYDHRVSSRVDVAYKKGMEDTIPEAHADAADEAGAGERLSAEGSRSAVRGGRSERDTETPGGVPSEQSARK